jgi:hypothetical protein
MMERFGLDHAERPRARACRRRGLPLAGAMLALMLMACLLGAAATAGAAAAAKPGKPVAKAPKGTITVATPTFSWTKAKLATKYEVRVYQGSKQLIKKTGVTKTSWKTTKALPKGVNLTWKVRASNASGSGAWSTSLAFKVAVSSAKAITAFSFQGLAPPVVGAVDQSAHTIALYVPLGTDVTQLVATFTTTGASVAVGATPQVSGTTANDFTSPVTYTVTAADATTQAYVVTVIVGASPAKAITAFSFQGLDPAVVGVVNEGTHTVALTVPFGTDVTHLVATFTTTGASVKVGSTLQVSGTTANDFTSPVTYTVTAADTSTQTYAVTVTVAANPAKAITAFSFQGLSPAVIGAVDQDAHTVTLVVPFGTDVTHLVATFTTTGASVKVGSTTQVSGTTANDFTSPVTYTVTAADTTTQAYVVTVTSTLKIGDTYGGGIVAYIYPSGDPGYVAGETHGLIVTGGDLIGLGIRWDNGSTQTVGTTSTALGTGSANTDAIIAVQGPVATSYAAGLARAYTGGGHSDWYLPSKDELHKAYLNKAAIGGSWDSRYYWTSSELSAVSAYVEDFTNGHQTAPVKTGPQGVRAFRSF